MERELAHETSVRKDIKTGRGGLTDVEQLVQLLQLRHGRTHAELLEPQPIDVILDRLTSLGLLEEPVSPRLRDGWRFLKRLSSRLRVVENRSISDLDEQRGDLEALARALGYEAGRAGRSASRKLLADYRRHTEEIRNAYLSVLDVEET
jgi:glutamate-ammonia-ligase adenylyltransferase